MIRIYSKPGCAACHYTKKFLQNHVPPIPFEDIDVTQDADAYAKVAALGRTDLPLVITPTDQWWGYRRDKLKGLHL